MAWIEAATPGSSPDDPHGGHAHPGPGHRRRDRRRGGDRAHRARAEEWDFPAHLLPAEARADTVLRLEWDGSTYRVLDIDPSMKPLEERLDRGLNRKRPIVFPLPQRDTRSDDEAPDLEVDIDRRVSRLHRRLGGR
ncbi:MAG: hypothetical protein U5R31_11385 [Acidimicrobiia bacterium]|nr:hypothetical protein [Acidimicrobiia bacterium]